MELAIEFSNDYIDITERKTVSDMQVQKCIRGKMPEGTFQSGIVINTNAVAAALKELLKEHQIRTKKAVLCVTGIDIIHKEVKIPKSKAKHVRGLLKNELNRMDTLRKGYVFDYITGTDPEGEVSEQLQNYSVFLMPVELIRNYEITLKRAGLLLQRVEPVSRSMEKLSQLLKLEQRKHSTILVSAERSEIDILMTGAGKKSIHRNIQVKEENIEENIFIVSTVQRLSQYTDPSERILDNLVDNISRLLQFQSQSNKGQTVDQILVYGAMGESDDFISNVEQRTGITAKPCEITKSAITFADKIVRESCISFNTIGAGSGKLLHIKKELSFYHLPDEEDTITIKDRIPLLVGLACIVALSVFYGVTVIGNMNRQSSIMDMQSKISEIKQSQEYQRRIEVQNQLLQLIAYNENCIICIETLESTKRFQVASFEEVDALVPQDIVIGGHLYEDGKIIFQCISKTQDGPAQFAKAVSGAKLFAQVAYTGFDAYQDIDGNTWYNFQLECSE